VIITKKEKVCAAWREKGVTGFSGGKRRNPFRVRKTSWGRIKIPTKEASVPRKVKEFLQIGKEKGKKTGQNVDINRKISFLEQGGDLSLGGRNDDEKFEG